MALSVGKCPLGGPRCPASICDCFVEEYPDDPLGLHPEAFAVWTGAGWFIPKPLDRGVDTGRRLATGESPTTETDEGETDD